MRKIVALLLALTLTPPMALAHSHKKNGLEIIHPWTFAMAEPRVQNIAVYMTIKNDTKSADRLLSVTTPHAEKAELIEPQVPMPIAALTIPAQGKLELNSDGPRLLLSGFKKKLNAYDSFELVLIFEKAKQVKIEVMVEEAEIAEQPHKH
jgi:copper(I)-binding protein